MGNTQSWRSHRGWPLWDQRMIRTSTTSKRVALPCGLKLHYFKRLLWIVVHVTWQSRNEVLRHIHIWNSCRWYSRSTFLYQRLVDPQITILPSDISGDSLCAKNAPDSLWQRVTFRASDEVGRPPNFMILESTSLGKESFATLRLSLHVSGVADLGVEAGERPSEENMIGETYQVCQIAPPICQWGYFLEIGEH
jgi:hypothetical protein